MPSSLFSRIRLRSARTGGRLAFALVFGDGRHRHGRRNRPGPAPPHADRAAGDRQAGRGPEDPAGRPILRRPSQPRPAGFPAGPDRRPHQRPGPDIVFITGDLASDDTTARQLAPPVRNPEEAPSAAGRLRLHRQSRILRRPGEDLRGHPGRRRAHPRGRGRPRRGFFLCRRPQGSRRRWRAEEPARRLRKSWPAWTAAVRSSFSTTSPSAWRRRPMRESTCSSPAIPTTGRSFPSTSSTRASTSSIGGCCGKARRGSTSPAGPGPGARPSGWAAPPRSSCSRFRSGR